MRGKEGKGRKRGSQGKEWGEARNKWREEGVDRRGKKARKRWGEEEMGGGSGGRREGTGEGRREGEGGGEEEVGRGRKDGIRDKNEWRLQEGRGREMRGWGNEGDAKRVWETARENKHTECLPSSSCIEMWLQG